MKFVLIVLLSATCCLCRENFVSTIFSNAAPKGFCYIKDMNLTIPDGGEIKKVCGACNKYSCAYPTVQIIGCDDVDIMRPDGTQCRAAEDLSKPYPECCSSNRCRE